MINVRYYIRKPRGGAVLSTKLTDLSPIVTDFIRSTERGARTVAAVAAADYLIGDGRHGLKHYPSYKYVTRKKAYGKTFFTEKQRRWFWANGGPKMIGNHRNLKLKQGWKRRGNGTDITIYNDQPHVLPVMGDDVQSRHERLVGWRVVSDVIETNLNGALRASENAVEKYYQQKAKE